MFDDRCGESNIGGEAPMDIMQTAIGVVIVGGLLTLFIAIFWSDIRRPTKRPGQPLQRDLDEAKHGMDNRHT
jgi:hypothetical protein